MPDLEQQISSWRKQMLAAGFQTPVPLDELESHLRDDIARQMESGVGPQTAFETAIKKIGKATMLKKEFAKVQVSPGARFIIVVLVPIIVSLFSVGITLLLLFKIGTFSQVSSTQIPSCLAAAAAMAIFGWSGLLAQRLFPAIPNIRVRGTVCIGGAVLLVLWWSALFFVILPRSEFTMGSLLVALLWGFAMPVGMFAGLCSGLEKAAICRAIA